VAEAVHRSTGGFLDVGLQVRGICDVGAWRPTRSVIAVFGRGNGCRALDASSRIQESRVKIDSETRLHWWELFAGSGKVKGSAMTSVTHSENNAAPKRRIESNTGSDYICLIHELINLNGNSYKQFPILF
jgi:hypothetical protein